MEGKFFAVDRVVPSGMIEVKDRCWLARTAHLEACDLELELPEIMYIDSGKVRAPDFARVVLADSGSNRAEDGKTVYMNPSGYFRPFEERAPGIDPGFRKPHDRAGDPSECIFSAGFSSDDLKCGRGEIVPVGNAISLFRDPRRAAETLSGVRRDSGPDRAVYAAGIADPINLSLLLYLGVDIVDSYGTVMRSSLGQIAVNGRIISSGSEEAAKILGVDGPPTFEDIYAHNIMQLEHELLVVRDGIRRGTLRPLVELRSRHEIWTTQVLRYCDREFYDLMEPWTPLTGPPFSANSKESLWRPDIERYRRRIVERYLPPPSPQLLLLLPCSAKKPYSISSSHRLFRDAIRGSGVGSAVHEVIVTSPLGIVPRDLELVYPARQYDIPVTGHWDEDEKHLIRSMLLNLLQRRRYDHIVAHLDSEMEFLSDILEGAGAILTGGESVTSRKSLEALRGSLSSLSPELSGTSWRQRTLEDVTALVSYQFGEDSMHIMSGSETRGRYPSVRILKDGKQVASMVPDHGSISLTLEGGRLLSKSNRFGVEIDDFQPKTNVFAVGVVDADPGIRIGDEVFIHHGGEVRAVGTARMNPSEMISLSRGEAVHIRHHA